MRRFWMGLLTAFVLATGIGVGIGSREASALSAPVCFVACCLNCGNTGLDMEMLCCTGPRGRVCTNTGRAC
jgi:hypothetical protein